MKASAVAAALALGFCPWPEGDAARGEGGTRVLFDFETGEEMSAVRARGGRAERVVADGDGRLRLRPAAEDGTLVVELSPSPRDTWDLSEFGQVSAIVRNAGDGAVGVSLRIQSEAVQGSVPEVSRRWEVAPGPAVAIRLAMEQADRRLASLRGRPSILGRVLNPSRVTRLVFTVEPAGPVDLDYVIAEDRVPTCGDPWLQGAVHFPFIDEYGQEIHRAWPGKTLCEDDLGRQVHAESADLERHPSPPGRDAYGGWADGPSLAATGRFRSIRHGGKWWLVDPVGKLFFSYGLAGVRTGGGTPVEDRESWFRGLPHPSHPTFGEFFYASEPSRLEPASLLCFDVTRANLRRKHGPDWRRRSEALALRRLASWGFNTVGDGSDSSLLGLRRVPYVLGLSVGGPVLRMNDGIGPPFPDVFDPAFEEDLRGRIAGATADRVGDPWCIGYFVGNALPWGGDVDLALAAVRAPAGQAAKRALAEMLRRSRGTVEALNAAWGTDYDSWESFLRSTAAPDLTRARPDLAAFSGEAAERFFRIARGLLRSADPGALFLGSRFGRVHDLAVHAAARHCDVLSYNVYGRSLAGFKLPVGVDRPVLVSEFQAGALDRGPFHPGRHSVQDQDARATLLADFVHDALAHAQVVGCHWFQYRDQPATGREYDGENGQVGVVDIVDTPYPETVDAGRRVGGILYTLRGGGPEGSR